MRWSQQLAPGDVYGCRNGEANRGTQQGPDYDFGASPAIARLPNGKDMIVVGQKSGVGSGLDPDNGGKVVWQYRAGQGGSLGGIEWVSPPTANRPTSRWPIRTGRPRADCTPCRSRPEIAPGVRHPSSHSVEQCSGANAQQPPAAVSPQPAPPPVTVPEMPFDAATDVLKYSPDMNLGEVLGVAINSKNHLVVLNHPGSPTAGPLYGNASTQLLEFDLATGRFVRELGKSVYGLGYGHAIRFDWHDNLWVVDKGTNGAVRFNPAGYVTMNLGRRPESGRSRGVVVPHRARQHAAAGCAGRHALRGGHEQLARAEADAARGTRHTPGRSLTHARAHACRHA